MTSFVSVGSLNTHLQIKSHSGHSGLGRRHGSLEGMQFSPQHLEFKTELLKDVGISCFNNLAKLSRESRGACSHKDVRPAEGLS